MSLGLKQESRVKTERFKHSLMLLTLALSLGFVAVLGVVFPAAAFADDSVVVKKKSTEVSFDDVLVQGKYHFSDEAVTTVEDDKILDALLGVRTDFKDRIKKSMARQ